MLGLLFSLVNPIASIVGKIADAKVELAKAQTDTERVHAQERVETLQAKRDIMIAEAGGPYGWVNAWIRAGFALPFVIYNGKLVLWDKVLGWGSTDALSTELFQIEIACISFYFLYDITSRFKR